jgi:hypothetical protein
MIDTISIISCERNPSFLDETISYIPNNYNLEIFFQGNYTQDYNATIFNVDIKHDNIYKNSQFNYATALLQSKNGLIIEDDVYLSRNFEFFLNRIEEHLSTINRYAIALYSCYEWPSQNPIGIIEYPVDNFYGTQAMLYDKITAKEFGEFLMSRIGVEPYDLALKSYIKENPEVLLLASTCSIVQHIGHTSTGLGFYHQAGNFADQ